MKVAMKDIAEYLGISINAVSLALNNRAGVSDDTRMRVLRTADKMGYISKKNKYERTFCSMNMCVMIQRIYARDMDFYGKVLYAVTEEAKKNSLDTVMGFFDDDAFIVPKALEERRVSGIIIIGKIKDENIERLEEYNVPLVLVDHASLVNTVDSILTDNKLGGFIATKYLLDRGFKNIGYFGDLGYSLSIKERFFGFQEAMKRLGGVSGDELDNYIKKYSVTADIEHWILENDSKGIIEHIKRAKHLPDAFVCSNDPVAISLTMSLQSLGYRVPEDISVIGFDDIDMCEKIYPKLTTVMVDKAAMGKRAVGRIKHRILHRDAPCENTVMSVKMVERNSVKPKGGA